MSDRPLVCRACREAMPDLNWNNPCPHWRETPEHVARLEAQLRDSEARNETSLEVIRAREEHVEQQRVEIERIREKLAEAIARGKGGICHVLSGQCDCTLCRQDAKIAKQQAEIERLRWALCECATIATGAYHVGPSDRCAAIESLVDSELKATRAAGWEG